MFLNDILNSFLTEISLILIICINMVLSLFIKKGLYKFIKYFSICSIILSSFFIGINQVEPPYYAFNGNLISNSFVMFFKILILASGIMIFFLSRNFTNRIRNKFFEYYNTLIFGILSGLIIVSSNNFILLYLGVQMLSLTICLISSFVRGIEIKKNILNYLIKNIIFDGLFLFGILYLYLLTSSFNFNEIYNYINYSGKYDLFLMICFIHIITFLSIIGKVIILSGNFYKNNSYSNCAFITTFIPICYLNILIKFSLIMKNTYSYIVDIFISILIISLITYGIYKVIKSTNIKEFFGYNALVNISFMLLGLLSSLNVYGVSSILYYIIVYVITNIGLFSGLIFFNGSKHMHNVKDYEGIIYLRPYYTYALTICLLSFASIPLTGGFISKLYLFSSLVRGNYLYITLLVIVSILNLGCVLYSLNLVKSFFMRKPPLKNICNRAIAPKVLLYLSAFIIFMLFFYSNTLIQFCQVIAYEI